MALIIYPTEDWDSYLTVADAEVLMGKHILDMSTWNALSDPHKEIYVRQASLLIKTKITDPETTETPDDIELATAYLANYSVGKTMTNSDDSGNLKSKRIEGVIAKEWFSANKASNAFPDVVADLLAPYGYVGYGASTLKIERS